MRTTLASGTAAELVTPPDGVEPVVGVALCPDIAGLRPLFDDLCARLAADHGWAVCAVEPYPGQEHLPVPERLATPFDGPRLLADLESAADATGATRTAVMGFCMGGMLAAVAAGSGRFDRAVSFYGMIRVPDAWGASGLHEPLEALARPGACPTLAILGERDHYTPFDAIEALRAVGDHVEVVVYPDADHGFVHDPSRPAHRPTDALDAWARVATFVAARPAASGPGGSAARGR